MRHRGPPLTTHYHQQQNEGNGRNDHLMNSRDKINVELQITNSWGRNLNRRESVEDLTVILDKNQQYGLLPIQPTPPPLKREGSWTNDFLEGIKEFTVEDWDRLQESSYDLYGTNNHFDSSTSLLTTTTEEQINNDYYEDEDESEMNLEGFDRDSDILLHSDDEDQDYLRDENDLEGNGYLIGKKKVKVFPLLVDSPPGSDSKKKGQTKALQAAYNQRKEKLQRFKQQLALGRTSPSLFSINSQTPPPFRKSPCPSLDSFHQNSFNKKKPEVLSSIESLLVQIPQQSSSTQQHNHHNLSTVKTRPASMKANHRKKHTTHSIEATKTSRSISSHNVNLNCLQKDPIPDDYLGHHIATTSSRIQSKHKEHFAVSKNPILVVSNRSQYKEKKSSQANTSFSSSLPTSHSPTNAPPRKSTVREPLNRAPLYKIPQAPKRKKLVPEDLGLTYQTSVELDKGLPTSCQVDAKKVIMQTLINSWIGIGPSLGDVNIENRKPLNLKPSKITSTNPEERRKEILKLMYKDRQTEVKENILKPKQHNKKNR